MFHVFKTGENVISVSVDAKGKVRVYDSAQAKSLPEIGSFEADGVSDFNHAMGRFIKEHGSGSIAKVKITKQYDDDSCDEQHSCLEVFSNGAFKVNDVFYRVEYHPDETDVVGHEFWATVPLDVLRVINAEFPDGCEVGEEEDDQENLTEVVVAHFFRI